MLRSTLRTLPPTTDSTTRHRTTATVGHVPKTHPESYMQLRTFISSTPFFVLTYSPRTHVITHQYDVGLGASGNWLIRGPHVYNVSPINVSVRLTCFNAFLSDSKLLPELVISPAILFRSYTRRYELKVVIHAMQVVKRTPAQMPRPITPSGIQYPPQLKAYLRKLMVIRIQRRIRTDNCQQISRTKTLCWTMYLPLQ